MILLFWGLAAYGMSTILVYGSILDKPRFWIKRKSKFFGELLGCILCTSTWVGFFLSLTLGGLSKNYFNVPWYVSLFTDAMFTSGFVWMVNSVVEFFEESRIK